MHDGPLDKPNGTTELGTPFLHVTGRAASSADNAQATSLFMINDEGVWLIKRPREREALELFREIPPRWEDRTEADWLSYANAVKRKVYDGRFQFPREWPYYLGWNAQHSNAPGTTCFLPVVDNTRQYINVLLILLSEPRGKAPLFIDDWSRFKPSRRDGVGGVGGGEDRRSSTRSPTSRSAGSSACAGASSRPTCRRRSARCEVRTDHEAYFLMQNLMLDRRGAAPRRLGHGAPMIPHVWKRDAATGHLGLGFREHLAKPAPARWKRWPPVPASQPNYVGIDGVLEGLCPPYVTDMDAAVDQVLEEKFGEGGTYADAEVFGQVYRDTATRRDVHAGRRAPAAPEAVEYTKEICRYLVETYGRFPAHTDAFHLPGIWVQFSHLELEYYERFGNPAHARRQAEGKEIWNRE